MVIIVATDNDILDCVYVLRRNYSMGPSYRSLYSLQTTVPGTCPREHKAALKDNKFKEEYLIKFV